MMIVIICVLGGYIDGFYGYYLARPARCGTKINDNNQIKSFLRKWWPNWDNKKLEDQIDITW